MVRDYLIFKDGHVEVLNFKSEEKWKEFAENWIVVLGDNPWLELHGISVRKLNEIDKGRVGKILYEEMYEFDYE